MADPAAPDPAVVAQIVDLFGILWATKLYMVACFVMLCWDIIITFDEEVEKIWKQRYTGATVLFAINRYCTPLQFIINIVAFHLPAFSDPDVCHRFSKFTGAGTVVALGTVSLILILRTYALYARNIWVLILLSAAFVVQISIMGWVISTGDRLALPPGIIACIFAPAPSLGQFTISFHAVVLGFETLVFVLTLGRAIYLSNRSMNTNLLLLIIRDGSLYFLIIVFVNLINIFFFVFMPPGLQAINASFNHIMTVLVISRLMLNLRAVREQPSTGGSTYPQSSSSRSGTASFPKWNSAGSSSNRWKIETLDYGQSATWFSETVIGNLGNALETDSLPVLRGTDRESGSGEAIPLEDRNGGYPGSYPAYGENTQPAWYG